MEPSFDRPDEASSVNRAELFHQQIPLVLGELFCSGLMLAVYLLISKFGSSVLFGALLGTSVTLLNHFVMILTLLRAERSETPQKGQLAVQGLFTIRMIALMLVLFFALKSGHFDPIATLLPLCFLRISIFITELIPKKKGGN